MVVAENLSYHAKPGDHAPASGEFTYALHVIGLGVHVKRVRASSPASAIEQFQATRTGRRIMSPGKDGVNHVEVVFDSAHVEGRTRDTTFQFDFDEASGAVPGEDDIRQFSWTLAAAPRRFALGPKGEYHVENGSPDNHADAIGVIVDLPVRLPDGPVNVGDQWTVEWTGISRQNDGATFRFRQNAQLEAITDGPSPRARITFSTSGTLQIAPEQNTQAEETTLAAKGFVLLEIGTGLIDVGESAGTITTDITSLGLQIVHEFSATYHP